MAIPKIIHQTWKNESIPQEMATFQQTWKEHHPGWEYRLWTDRDNREFLENYYSWFLPVYDAYRENICRVDAVRYFIMYHYGGLYVDLDFECLRPVDQLLEEHRLIFGLEPDAHVDLPQVKFRNFKQIVCPSFIASEPAHPFWSYFFQYLVLNYYLPDPLDATGPFALTRAYNEYSAPSEIKLLPAKLLYPATKFDCWEGRINDQNFRQTFEQEAFAIHHWHGTWFKDKTAAMAAQFVKKLPLSLLKKGRVVLNSAFQYNLYQSLSGGEIELPLISCLMVTKNRVEQAKCAIQCFSNQTYAHRELVIIDDGEDEGLAEYTQQLQDSRIKYLHLPSENKTLGELRNLAVQAAGGTYICQWDDDDLSDPLRLEVQMAALLALAAEACFLQRWMLWWPSRRRWAISRIRVWEGSILCLKSRMLAYSEQRQGEDTPVVGQIVQNCRVALLDCPQLYAYVIHDRNTFDAEHFEQHWQLASERFEGINYDNIISQLCDRLPIECYLQVNLTPQPTLLPVAEVSAAAPNLTSSVAEPSQAPLVLDSNAFPKILILTPVKGAREFLPKYLKNLLRLTYPHDKISLGLLESDSTDGTFDWLQEKSHQFQQNFARYTLLKRDFSFHHTQPRWEPSLQFQRRSILAKSRNFLLSQSLQDEEWVLWLDVDVSDYPEDIIQRLLITGKEIVVPNCVVELGGETFDFNTFKFKPGAQSRDWSGYVIDGILQPPKSEGRFYLNDLRDREIVEVDGVGGTMLLIKADLHREGLMFPPFSYKLYIETEGLGMMAKDMGYRCWGLPQLEIVHTVH